MNSASPSIERAATEVSTLLTSLTQLLPWVPAIVVGATQNTSLMPRYPVLAM
jgi:hypothetical protein